MRTMYGHFMYKMGCLLSVCIFLAPVEAYGLTGIIVTGTRVVAVSDVIDTFGNTIIQAAVGTLGTNPSTWPISTISTSVSVTNNYMPKLFADNVGNILVVWGYLDQVSNLNEVAAAVLLSASSTWNAINVSQGLGTTEDNDYYGLISPSGDMYVVWSSYSVGNLKSPIVVTTTVLTPVAWTVPYTY